MPDSLFPQEIPTIPVENVPKPPHKRHAGGRPRTWTLPRSRALLEDVLAWLKTDEVRDDAKPNSKNDYHLSPYLYLASQGKDPDLMRDLPGKYPELVRLVQRIHNYQEQKIADLCVKGHLQQRFGQFYLSAKHGWAQTINNNQTHSGTVAMQHSGITVNFVEKTKPDQQ